MANLNSRFYVASFFLFSSLIFSCPVMAKESTTQQSSSISTTVTGEVIDTPPDFGMVAGVHDIEGEPNVLRNGARTSWKEECKIWKSEAVRNPEKVDPDAEKMEALDCGTPTCTSEDGQTICRSHGSFMRKTRIRDKRK